MIKYVGVIDNSPFFSYEDVEGYSVNSITIEKETAKTVYWKGRRINKTGNSLFNNYQVFDSYKEAKEYLIGMAKTEKIRLEDSIKAEEAEFLKISCKIHELEKDKTE